LLVLFSPGNAEADVGCGVRLTVERPFDGQLCQEYSYQKSLKSDNPSSSHNR